MTWDPNDPLRVTGNCYQVCAELLTQPGGQFADWEMVHGRPTLTRPPFIQYGHAWLRQDGIVFCPTAGVTMPEWMYLQGGQIDTATDFFVYDAQAARERMLQHEHYGPWQGTEAEGLP